MSCLSPDALTHFEQRERELLALNQQLEQQRTLTPGSSPGTAQAAEELPPRGLACQALSAEGTPPREATEAAQRGLSPAGSQRPPGVASRPPSASASRPPSGAKAVADAPDTLHATIRLQNARISALQEELDRTIAELAGRDGEARQLKHEVKQLSDENKRLLKAAGPAEQQQERLKKHLSKAESKIADLESERAELLKMKDQAESRMKKYEADCNSKEVRIHHVTEECEKYKQTLKEVNGQDRDRVAGDRKEIDRLTSEVRKLERQRGELVSAFKKQMKLIDVLKRQRAHMEAARVLSFTEDEFIRVLELGDKLGE